MQVACISELHLLYVESSFLRQRSAHLQCVKTPCASRGSSRLPSLPDMGSSLGMLSHLLAFRDRLVDFKEAGRALIRRHSGVEPRDHE